MRIHPLLILIAAPLLAPLSTACAQQDGATVDQAGRVGTTVRPTVNRAEPVGTTRPTVDQAEPVGTTVRPTVNRAEPVGTTVRPNVSSAAPCCAVVANAAMRGRLGRVVVAYPESVQARVDVFRAGGTQSIASGYGDQAFDLLPGTYDVEISGKRVSGVTIRSGHDTQVKVGVLRVSAGANTRVDLIDPDPAEPVNGAVDPAAPVNGARLTGGYGEQLFGLPIGEVGVQILGQTELVTIEDGQLVDF